MLIDIARNPHLLHHLGQRLIVADRGPYLAIGKRPPGGIVNGAGKVSPGWIITGSTEIVKPAEAGFHQVAVLLQSLTVGIPYLGKAEHPYL